jgi:hypothetical protein
MRRKRLVVPLVVAILMFASNALAQPSKVLSIAEARATPLGTTVTVEGVVSTPSGAFRSSFFDVGFGLQDQTGGIYVSLQTDLELTPHRRARVTGVLQENFGLRVIVPSQSSDVEPGNHTFWLFPRFLRTSAVSERSEGWLVSVVGKVNAAATSDLPYGYKLTIDDGTGPVLIFVNLETGIDLDKLAKGDRVLVVGFSSQFDDHYEIDPRSPHDVIELP